MKKCLQCEQVYGDDVNFCLSDGSTLVNAGAAFTEQPTFVGGSAASAPVQAKKSNALLIALVVGVFALIAGGAIAGAVIYGLHSSANRNAAVNAANVSSSANQSKQNATAEHKDDDAAANLKAQQDKLEKDRQKLEEERKRLEAQKKDAAQTNSSNAANQSNATTATIVDPPTNIRAAPNGTILCVMRRRGTVVNILGSTGVTDNNGTWYYTDACGARGVIHSTQIKF